jgi:hypothetical protein
MALEEFFAYEEFGSNVATDDQPVEWVDAIMAVSTAKRTVKDKIEKEQQEKREKKAKEQRNKSKAGKSRRKK